MTVNYTTLLGLAKPVSGTESGTWGDTVNTNLTDYLDSAVAGAQIISGSLTAVTLSKTTGSSLSQAGTGSTGSSQYQIIRCTGNPASLLTITAPAADKTYIIINATSTAQSVKIVGVGPTPTGVTILSGKTSLVAWNGSDFVEVSPNTISGTLPVANGGTGATTLTGVLKGNGTSAFTAASSGTDYSAGTSALATGILKSTTSTGALTIAVAADFPILNQSTTGTASNLTAATTLPSGMTLVAPALGTPSSGTLTNCTGYTYANLSGTVPTWNQNTTGTAATATNLAAGSAGTIPYQSASGTTAMLAAGTSGYVLTSNGATAPSWAPAGGGSSLSGFTGISNTALGVSTLPPSTTGINNSAVGAGALVNNTSGGNNTAVGTIALIGNHTGSNNVAVGYRALNNNDSGSGNSAFNPIDSSGSYAPVFDPTTQDNRFCMGSTGVTNAYIQVAWTVVSDARDKTNFASVPHGLDFVNKLLPTAYQFKKNRETDVPTGIVRYGFKAQDILALEGDTPVIIDTENLDKLRFNSDSLIPVLVNAIKELTARLEILENKVA